MTGTLSRLLKSLDGCLVLVYSAGRAQVLRGFLSRPHLDSPSASVLSGKPSREPICRENSTH